MAGTPTSTPASTTLGVAQAAALADRLGPLADAGPPQLVTSPMRRCRETAAPLAARWGVDADVEPLVTEIPSPEGVRDRPSACRGCGRRWPARGPTLGPRYTAYRDAVAGFVAGCATTP